MGVNYFSDEQVKELEKNPYVKKKHNLFRRIQRTLLD